MREEDYGGKVPFYHIIKKKHASKCLITAVADLNHLANTDQVSTLKSYVFPPSGTVLLHQYGSMGINFYISDYNPILLYFVAQTVPIWPLGVFPLGLLSLSRNQSF